MKSVVRNMNGRTNSTIGTNDIIEVPLDPATGLVAIAGNGQVELTWMDPKDKYATPEGEQAQDPQQLVSVWAYTKIVRKAGSVPTGPNDGVLVVSSEVRNAYQSEPFIDNIVKNDTTYYYGAFAYNEDSVISVGTFSDGVTPKSYDPILNNNSWEQIAAICAEGIAPSVWEIGDEKDITISGQVMTTVIVGFNQAPLNGGGGNAVITFGSKYLLSEEFPSPKVGYGAISNFTDTEMYEKILNDVVPKMETDLRKVLQTVAIPIVNVGNVGGHDNIAVIQVGAFSMGEIFGENDDGPQYPYFATSNNRIKRVSNDAGSLGSWWTRSPNITMMSSQLYYWTTRITTNGSSENVATDSTAKLCFCFFVGKENV